MIREEEEETLNANAARFVIPSMINCGVREKTRLPTHVLLGERGLTIRNLCSVMIR